jgi:hypothetical protein
MGPGAALAGSWIIVSISEQVVRCARGLNELELVKISVGQEILPLLMTVQVRAPCRFANPGRLDSDRYVLAPSISAIGDVRGPFFAEEIGRSIGIDAGRKIMMDD